MSTKWQSTTAFPFKFFSRAININGTDFAMMATNKFYRAIGDGVYQWNAKDKQWSNIFKYEKNFKGWFTTLAFN